MSIELEAGPGGGPVTARQDVIDLYRGILGREPEDEGAITGRLGLPLWLVETEIFNSPEAVARRAAELAAARERGEGPAEEPTPPRAPADPRRPVVVAPPVALPGPLGVAMAALQQLIDKALAPIGAKLDEISGGKLRELGRALEGVKAAIDATTARVTEELTSALIDTAGGALALADVALRKSNELVGGFLASAADVLDVARAFEQVVTEKREAIGDFVLQFVGGAFGGGLSGFLEALEGEGPELLSVLPQKILASPAVTPEVRALLEPIAARTRPVNFIMGILVGSFSLGSISSAVMGPTIELYRQTAHAAEPVEIPGVGELAAAEVRGIIPSTAAEALARRQGFEPVPYRIFRELARVRPAPAELAAAWLRGLIGDEALDTELMRLGLTEQARGVVKALAFVVATPQDVIRLAVRDVYFPDRRSELRLDEDFPPRVLEEARKAGVPEQLIRDLWAGHWELPSLEQVFEMLHRKVQKADGSTWSIADVERFMVTADVAPAFRPLLRQISFNVLRLVDIRNARKAKVIDFERMKALLGERGYSPRDAEIVADLFERSVNREDKVEKADLTAGLRSRVVGALMQGRLAEPRARAWLEDLGADPEDIAVAIAEAKELRAGARADRIRELVERLYVAGRWTLEEATGELRRRGFGEAELEAIREEVRLERRLREPEERELADRDLTKAEVVDAMSAGILGEPQARELLGEMRYDPSEVDVIVALEKHREVKRVLAEEIEVLHRRRVAGRIDELTATTELDALGLTAEHRNRLLEKWSTEIRGKGADFTWATVGELARRRLMPGPEAEAYLVRLGFDERERELSLALWGAQGAEAAARARTAEERAARAATARMEAQERRRRAVEDAAKRRQRDLSKADLVRAWGRRVIGEPELRGALLGLGYDESEVDVIIATEKARQGGRTT